MRRRVPFAAAISITVIVGMTLVLAAALQTENRAWNWALHTREVLQHVERASSAAMVGDRYAAEAEARALAALTADNPRQTENVRRLAETPVGSTALALLGAMRSEEERLLASRTGDAGRARLAAMGGAAGLALLAIALLAFVRAVARSDAASMAELASQRQVALDAARLGWWHYDPGTKQSQYDARYREIFGVQGSDAPNDRLVALIHEDDRPRVWAAVEEALDPARRTAFAVEYRIRRPDGAERWIEAHGIAVFDGPTSHARPTSFVGTVQDVTERKQAEVALRESEERTRMLADNMSQLAWIADRSGSITWYNKRWYDYTGTTLAEMRGWGWKRVHHPEHVERVVERISHAFATGEPWEDTFPLRGRDGSYRWFLSRAVPIRGADGEILQWFGTNTDITEQRDAEMALAGLNRSLEKHVARRTQALEQANAELEAFTYSVSHDLRAPLRGIHGYAQALEEDYRESLAPEARAYLDRICGASARMEDLIQDLLAYSRLAREDIEVSSVPLGSVVDAALVALRSDIEARHAAIEVQPRLPTVRAARPVLLQVVQNLLANAIKFVPPGTAPRVEVRAGRRDGRVRLIVSDNGIGIEERHRERIFRVFERLHGADVYPGTGIGLAIVRKGVERMGGEAGVDSTPGRGSHFWIDLPAGE